MISLAWGKAKLIALGGLVMSVLAFFLRMQVLKNQRDKARHTARIMTAQVNRDAQVEKVRKAVAKAKREDLKLAKEQLERGDEITSLSDDINSW